LAGRAFGFAAIAPLDVPIPGMRDYIIVAYKDGATTMKTI
jgi:hypothetical protein